MAEIEAFIMENIIWIPVAICAAVLIAILQSVKKKK